MMDAEYRSRGLEILAFPCNQFFWREFSRNSEIKKYIISKGVAFKVFDRVDVNGRNACQLYKFLRKNSSVDSTRIGLNFGKFLVDKTGKVNGYYGPLTNPAEILNDIERLL